MKKKKEVERIDKLVKRLDLPAFQNRETVKLICTELLDVREESGSLPTDLLHLAAQESPASFNKLIAFLSNNIKGNEDLIRNTLNKVGGDHNNLLPKQDTLLLAVIETGNKANCTAIIELMSAVEADFTIQAKLGKSAPRRLLEKSDYKNAGLCFAHMPTEQLEQIRTENVSKTIRDDTTIEQKLHRKIDKIEATSGRVATAVKKEVLDFSSAIQSIRELYGTHPNSPLPVKKDHIANQHVL